MTDTLRLRLLDSYLVVSCDDLPSMDLLRSLWEPCVVEESPPQAAQINIVSTDGGFEVTGPAHRFDAESSVWAVANLVRYIAQDVALADSPYLLLHAAALSKGTGALLLAGPSGAGKTTLTLELLCRGFGYLSDDLAPMGLDGEVRPFLRPLGVKDPARWNALSGLFGEHPPFAPGMPFLLPPTLLDPQANPLPVTTLVFIDRTEGAPVEIRTLSAGESAARALLQLPGVGAGPLRSLTSLVKKWSCLEISYGEAASAAASLCPLVP